VRVVGGMRGWRFGMLGVLWGLEEGRGRGMGEALLKGWGSEMAFLGGLECLGVACRSGKVLYGFRVTLLCAKTV